MDPDRWLLVKDSFSDALALDVAARQRLLGTLDRVTRAEVEAMLAATEGRAGILDAPLSTGLLPTDLLPTGVDRAVHHAEVGPMPAALPGPLTDSQIGPYRVGPRIGRGGMGDVYRARRVDGLFERTVALKVVREGADSDAVLARFAAERRILGSLEHPGIARLIAAGAETDGPAAGRPWLALELVDGVPVTEATRDRSLDARLALLIDVAEAVHHAHQQLVVHRDLKPSNVLVAQTPQGPRVKLLDFGIAKILDPVADAGLTELDARRPMTQAYAAPEQVRGERATTATDVYGLGLLLFEVLTGTRPFATDQGRQALEVAVLRGDVPPPSRASRPEAGGLDGARLRGDLDAICRTALATAPEDRYASAAALAADLRAVRAHEPVAARAPSAAYRARRFVRRHRAGVATAVGVALAAVLGGAFYTARLADERDRAEAARAEAEATSTFLEDVLGAASPFATDRRDTLRVADVLADAARQVGTMEATPARQGHLYTVIGRTYDDLGRSAEADSLLRLAVARLDDDPIRWSRAATALGAVLAKGDSADFAEAEALFRRVLAVRQARLAPTDTDLADAYADLGFVLWRQGAFEPAVEAAEHAVSLHRAGVPPDSAGLASALNVLGDALESAQRMDEAEGVFREMLRVRRAWFGPNHPSVPVGLSSFAGFLRNMGRYDEAAPFAREAFEVSRATLGPDHPNTLEHSILVASILRGQGRPDEAVPIIEDVIDRILRTDGPDHPYLAYYYDQHARALMAAERYDEAAAVLALGLAAARSTAGTPSIEGANIVAKQGSVALSLGDAAAAVRLYRAAVDEFGQVFGTSENAFSAGVLNGYGQALLAAGRTRPARAAFRESVAAFDAVYGPGNEQGASVRERLAEVTAL